MTRRFHDAVVVAVRKSGEDLVFAIERVSVQSGADVRQERGSLVVHDVNALLEDGVRTQLPTFEYDDGQILKLSRATGQVRLLIEWENYSAKRTKTSEYVASGASVRWLPEPQGEFQDHVRGATANSTIIETRKAANAL